MVEQCLARDRPNKKWNINKYYADQKKEKKEAKIKVIGG